MKIINSKVLVLLATVAFVTIVILRFMAIQNLDTSKENFYIYNIKGDKLFTLNNDLNSSYVTIADSKRVKLKGFYKKEGDRYRVLPYTFLDINSSKGRLVFQFVTNSKKNSFSYNVRFRKYEVIGGSSFGGVESLIRLNSNDSPLLVIFPSSDKKIFGKTNTIVRAVALKDNLYFINNRGEKRKIPYFSGRSLNTLENKVIREEIKPLKLSKDGVVLIDGSNSVLNIYIDDGYVSKKYKDKYILAKTKKIYLNLYQNSNRIDKLKLTYADKGFFVKRGNTTYLNAPKEIPLEKRVIVRGSDYLFNNSKYLSKSGFPTEVPILDKPNIKHKIKKSRYFDYIDIDNLYGLYVSDKNALVYYSTDKKRWIKAIENYKYAPPLYLYFKNIEGQFIAPPSLKRYKKEIYYKIVSKKKSLKIAFNGKIKIDNLPWQNSNYKRLIDINGGEIILATKREPLKKCGYLFTLNELKEMRYKIGSDYKSLKVVKNKNGYDYYINEKLNPFKTYKVSIKDYKEIEYQPQLSCKYDMGKNKEILSLYDKSNMISLIPKRFEKRVKRVKSSKNKKRLIANIENELIPIYGDGIRFGLLSSGVKDRDLTLDKNFTLKVSKIFTNRIKPLLNNTKLQDRLKRVGEQIEGATVVLKIKKDGSREIVSLFSYPYPNSNNLQREIILDAFNHRQSTLKNRALDMLVHPGSTFKLVTSISMFNNNIDMDKFNAIAKIRDLYNAPIGDFNITFHLKNYTDHRGFTEVTNYTDYINALAHSYNTYFGYAGLLLYNGLEQNYKPYLFPIDMNLEDRVNEYKLIKTAQNLYFNKKIPLSKKYKIFATASNFPTIFTIPKEIADSAIGQYDVYATPLQMAIVASVLYDNRFLLPNIIKGENLNKKLSIKDKIVNIFSNKNFVIKSTSNYEQIKEAMKNVITNGTAKVAFKHYKPKNFTIYGKTGTAQKGKKGLYDGWFISFTKGLKEDIVIATVVKNSGTGAEYAAPINREIIKEWVKRFSSKKPKNKN